MHKWEPCGFSQKAFVHAPVFEVLYGGTRGSGKTDSLLAAYLFHVNKGFGPAWRGIIFRKSFPQLSDLIAKSKKMFKPYFGNARFLSSMTDYKWIFPTGEELLFRYIAKPDDYWNYHGHEYPFIGFEELTNWATGECYDAMKSCCRSSAPGIPKLYRSTCNPHGAGHNWVKSLFIDPAPQGQLINDELGNQRVYIHGHWSENQFLVKNDPQYIARLKSISEPNRRKAWLEGSWDITSGGMFDDVWNKNAHVIKPFKIPDEWYINRSFDWGSSAPFSVCWWAESNGEELPDGRIYPAGTLFLIAEWYGCDSEAPNTGLKMLSGDVAEGILEREQELGIAARVDDGPADSAIWAKTDGPTVASNMSDAGVDWVKADKSAGSRVAGAEELRKRLTASLQSPMERPGLFIFDTCRAFIRTVPALPRSDKNSDDVDTNAEDHCYDSVRYRLSASNKVIVL